MGSDPADIAAAYADLEAAHARVAALDYSVLTVPQILGLRSRHEILTRRNPIIGHHLLAELQTQTTAAAIGARNWVEMLRIRERLSLTEARRQVRDTANLTPQTTLTGHQLPPRREHTAAAQAAGTINPDHIDQLEHFHKKMPPWVDPITAAQAEAQLVDIAVGHSPEELREAIDRTLYLLNQDGEEPIDTDNDRNRGINVHRQNIDGNSDISGKLTPELRATYDPLLAKLAAPGMCNPADEHPCITGTPSEEAIRADTRTPAQRVHDALLVIGRHALMSGDFGQHNGLPVSIVVTTTLNELEAGAGMAVTRSGSRLPIPDLIRLAAHAHHYLAVFDDATQVPLYFGRTKRIATPGQRLLLFARDRGCTRPGCTAAADHCQAHHATQDFADGGLTNIDDLTLGCGPDQRLVRKGGWRTHINQNGRCEWIPPQLLDTGQPRINNYHHPQNYLTEPGDQDSETDCHPA